MLKTVTYLTQKKLRLAKFNITDKGCSLILDKSIPLVNSFVDTTKLKEVFQKEGLYKTKVTCCIFRHEVGVRFFNFPSHDRKEIARMVDYEATELLPLKPEETTTRYLILNSQKNGYSDVLVVVTHRMEVAKLIQKFQDSAVEIDTLSLSSLAILNCVRYSNTTKENSILEKNFLVVYLEDGIVEIIIAKKGIMVFSRGFLISDAKNFYQVLIGEIRHSMEAFFNSTKESKLERIIVGGADSTSKEIEEMFKKHFDIPITVEKNVDIAYGLALSDDRELNLLSDEFIEKRTAKRLKRKLLISSLLVVANIFLVAAIFLVSLNNKQAYLKALEKELNRLKPEAQATQNKIQKLRMIQTQLTSQLLILDAITDLINVTSDGTTLNMLSLNEEGVMVVRGQTKTLGDVLDFVSAIEKSPYFMKSHLNYSSRRKTKNEELIDFEIQANLETEQKTR